MESQTPATSAAANRLFGLTRPSESEVAASHLRNHEVALGKPASEWTLADWREAALTFAVDYAFEKEAKYRSQLALALLQYKAKPKPRGRPKGSTKHDPEQWKALAKDIDEQVARERAEGRTSNRKNVVLRDLRKWAEENGETVNTLRLTKRANYFVKNLSRYSAK